MNDHPTILRQFVFPLPSGSAHLNVQYPMTDADFSALIRILLDGKDGLVKKDMPWVDCGNSNWAVQAENLAKAGAEFALVGLKYVGDLPFVTNLAKGYQMQLIVGHIRTKLRKEPDAKVD